MSRRVLPLSRFPLVRTRDADEAIDLYARFSTPVHVDLPKRRQPPFEWNGNAVMVGALELSAHALGCSMKLSTDSHEDVYSLSIPIGGAQGEGWLGKQKKRLVQLKGGKLGIIASPGEPGGSRLGARYEGVQLQVRGPDMEDALAILVGRPLSERLVFVPAFSLETTAGAAFHRLLRFVLNEAETEGGVVGFSHVADCLAEAVLFQMLLSQPHSHSALLEQPSRPAEPKYVSQVAEYLEAHSSRPIRMAELARLTGMSVRSLQAGFRKYRGESPLEFLRERRLMRARQRLLAASDDSVTEVALGCGLSHAGRFSIQYRARYGESPSETLAKAQRKGARAARIG